MKTIKIISGNTKQFAVDEYGRSYILVEGKEAEQSKKTYRWVRVLTPEEYEKTNR